LLVVAMKRTSISTLRSDPIGVTRFSSMARRSLDCRASGISPTSSSSRVPPLATWKNPRRVSVALVKAPLRKPNSSDSNSSAGMAAQSTARKGSMACRTTISTSAVSNGLTR
jgi:hypothetical protein